MKDYGRNNCLRAWKMCIVWLGGERCLAIPHKKISHHPVFPARLMFHGGGLNVNIRLTPLAHSPIMHEFNSVRRLFRGSIPRFHLS